MEKLNEKYGGVVGSFIEMMGKHEMENNYRPRIVVDDDIDDDYDDS